MVESDRSKSLSAGWSMDREQIERFVGMERDIKQLRQDMTKLESDVREIKVSVAEIRQSLAEGRGAASTWPKAGQLLIGVVTVTAAVGGWVIALWNMAAK